jgi:hypothetical protein
VLALAGRSFLRFLARYFSSKGFDEVDEILDPEFAKDLNS